MVNILIASLCDMSVYFIYQDILFKISLLKSLTEKDNAGVNFPLTTMSACVTDLRDIRDKMTLLIRPRSGRKSYFAALRAASTLVGNPPV